MKDIVKYIVLTHLLIILVVLGCVGKQFVTQKEESDDAGNTTNVGDASTINNRSDDYLQCCVLEHSCMIQLESENSGMDASSNRIPIQDRSLVTE